MLLSMPLLMVSCGDDDDEPNPEANRSLIGCWMITGGYYGFELKADGTTVEVEKEHGEVYDYWRGTWKLNGKKLILSYIGDGEDRIYEVLDVTSTTLIVEDTYESIKTYKRVSSLF